MADSSRAVLKNVFSNRNIVVISLTTTIWSMCDNGWRTFWPLWLKNELGASIAAVGLLSMIRDSGPFLFQLPGGVLADKFGRKKIIILGTSIRFIPPFFFLLSSSWEQTIPAMILSALTSIYMPAFNAIVADSLPSRQRGAGYGAYRMMTSLPMVIMPVIGGIIMDSYGYRDGVRIFLFAEIIASVFIVYLRWRYISETLDKKAPQKASTEPTVSTPKIPRTVWMMAIVSTISSFGMRLVMQFASIYAKDIVQITNTELGLASTVSSLMATLLSMPGGMLADRVGRRPMILLPMVITPLTTFSLTLISGFQQYLGLQVVGGLAMGIGGGAYGQTGGSAWQALMADLVPREKRGTVNGIIGTVTGLVGAPSSWIGGYMWENYSPETPFQATLVLGLLALGVFALFVKEPKKGEE